MDERKAKTLSAYNKNARKTAANYEDYLKQPREEFSIFSSLLSGKRVLDLGAGPGDVAIMLKNHGLNVTCIDFSEEMVRLCKEKKLDAYVMDIEDLQFQKELFDGIWAAVSLLHVPKERIPYVILSLHQILKQDGILYVSLRYGDNEQMLQGEDGSEKFYAFWQKDEFLHYAQDNFELLQYFEVPYRGKLFMHFFYRKR